MSKYLFKICRIQSLINYSLTSQSKQSLKAAESSNYRKKVLLIIYESFIFICR